MVINFLNKKSDGKKQQEELKKFWKEQFSELTRKQLGLPIKLYQL